MNWLSSFFGRFSFQGVSSRRLVSVTVGAVLLAWLHEAMTKVTVPEIPGSVIAMLLLVVGSGALKEPGA